MKLRQFLLTALAAALLLTGCRGEDQPAEAGTTAADTTAAVTEPVLPPIVLGGEGAPTYAIVRADEADPEEITAAIQLNRRLTECGVAVTITTDWKKNPVSDYELVVGQTTRTETDTGFAVDMRQVGEEGFVIKAVGSRIYLMGGSPAATVDAVEYFLSSFFDSTLDASGAVSAVSIPGDYAYFAYEQYALSVIDVAGRSLRDFAIRWTDSVSAAAGRASAEYLQQKLMTLTGFWLPIIDEGEIWDGPSVCLAVGGDSDFTAVVRDGDLLMTANDPHNIPCGIAGFIDAHIRGVEGELHMDNAFSYTAEIGEYVTYSQFGAKGDGKTDDSAAIRAAHEYANANGLEVRADYGATYYIGVLDNAIHVRTSADWTGASFLIDDRDVSLDKRGVSLFYVVPDMATYDIAGQIKTVSRDQTKFDIRLPANAVIVLTDTGTMRYIREGANANKGKDQVDTVVVDKNGNIDMRAPLLWEFANVTSAKVYPVDEEPVILRGGTFTTIANNQESVTAYYKRGLHISRSNVIVEDIVHYVEGEGTHGAPYQGILSVSDCTNIIVRDCVFTAHRAFGGGGSYDIALTRVVNITLENCTQTTDILDTDYWGIMVSSYCKNITLKDCTFSRFDAHEGVINAAIIDSTLGHQCLNAIGGGTLLVENVKLYGSSLINLRPDYGSTWEGDVIIRNCTWVPNKGNTITGKHAIFGGRYSGYHNFGYECYMPANVTIENLHIDDTKAGAGYDGIYLFGNITAAHTSEAYEADVQKNGYPYHITETVTISGFTSESGKKWMLSPNTFMFRNVKVNDLDAKQ